MHEGEVHVDETIVRRLLAEQFPRWAELSLSLVVPLGTDHTVFRLGDDLSVRLPRRNGSQEPGGKEATWLPKLAPLLPLAIPVPVAQGTPTKDYPWYWEIHTWVPGRTVAVETIDAAQAARDLAWFVSALQKVDPTNAPEGRGMSLEERDEFIRPRLASFGDPAVTAEWERALGAEPWRGKPVWHHGDLDARNWLVENGRISGVIDWGVSGVGDPACDIMVAWKLHSDSARDAFRSAIQVDEATWDRARGWALSQSVAALTYYTPETNPTLYHEAQCWLALVMSERGRA